MAIAITDIKKRIAQVNSMAIIERENSTTNPLEIVSLLKAISAPNIDLAHESVEYRGANSIFPYAADIISANGTITITTKEFPPALMDVIMRTSSSTGAAEATGDVGTIVDVSGTTWSSAVTGIASHALTVGEEPTEGDYIFKYASATTFNIYVDADNDDLDLAVDETGKVNSAVYTLVNGAELVITELGITLTAGSAVALAATDTCKVTLRKFNLGYITSDIGAEVVGRYYRVVLAQALQTGGTATKVTLYKCLVTRGAIDNPDGENATMQLTLKPCKDQANSNKIGQTQWTIGVNA